MNPVIAQRIVRASAALTDLQYSLEEVSDQDGLDTVADMLLKLRSIHEIHLDRAERARDS